MHFLATIISSPTQRCTLFSLSPFLSWLAQCSPLPEETQNISSEEQHAMQTAVFVQLIAPGKVPRSLLLSPRIALRFCEPQ
jgi:hypothetical protein